MQSQLRTPPLVLRVIWFALVVSTAIYALVVYVISASQPHLPFQEAVRSQTTLIMYGLCVASFFAGTMAWTALRNRPLQLRMVMSMAIFETGAIFGLLAAFIAHDWRLYVPAWFVTLIGFMRCFPSDTAIEESRGMSAHGIAPLS